MDASAFARKRHTAKAYNPARKIPQDVMARLLTALRFSPSSVNLQPWHFFIASSDTAKARLATALTGNYAYNAPKVRDASHVILFCSRSRIGDDHLDAVLTQEEKDGRFATPEAKATQAKSRLGYVTLHRSDLNDVAQWAERQTYLALGALLLSASIEDIDATPMEGFDATALDRELGLTAKGLAPLVLVSLGYHGDEDFNAKLPKSRLPENAVFTNL